MNLASVPPHQPDYRGISAPNTDTLYSIAWPDLAERQVFSHPDMGNRYYVFEVNPNPGISITDEPQAVILAMATEGYFNIWPR